MTLRDVAEKEPEKVERWEAVVAAWSRPRPRSDQEATPRRRGSSRRIFRTPRPAPRPPAATRRCSTAWPRSARARRTSALPVPTPPTPAPSARPDLDLDALTPAEVGRG